MGFTKMKYLIAFFLFTLSHVTFCQSPITGNWKLISVNDLLLNKTDTAISAEAGAFIKFKGDTLLGGRLSKNEVLGSYQILKDNIKIRILSITEMCCDTKESQRLLEISGMNTFSIRDSSLVLESRQKLFFFRKVE